MSKSISLEYNGNRYTLEFNRNAIRRMERSGFIIGDIGNKPVTMLPELFAGAFIMHHPYLKRQVIDEIFDNVSNRAKLVEKLGEMFNEPIAAMMDEPEGGAGNASWQEG